MKKSDTLQKVLLTLVLGSPEQILMLKELAKDKKAVKGLLRLAKVNGVQYYCLEKLRALNMNLPFLKWECSEEIKRGLANVKRTISILNEMAEDTGLPYILIKGCNTVPHIPRDIDIFVRRQHRDAIVERLKRCGMKCKYSSGIETTLTSEGHLPIDIYTRVIYFGEEFFDEDFLFNSLTKRRLLGVEYYGLNNEAEFMLNLVHCLFGHGSLKLLDYLHLKNIRESGLSIDFCKKYAKKMGWGGVFSLALRKLEEIERKVSGGEEVVFPYLFDIKFLMYCVKQIENIVFNKSNEITALSSFLLDFAKLRLESSILYDVVKKARPLRTLLLAIGHKSRTLRGDRYS
jgi:hypothetical protein